MTTDNARSASQPFVLPLWEGVAPGSEDWTHSEIVEENHPPFGIRIVRNVVQPTLIAYLPDPAIATGSAVIVCPGGAFHILAIDHEGHEVAHWLNSRGVAVFVLKYRVAPAPVDSAEFSRYMQELFSGDHESRRATMQKIIPLTIDDAKQAIRLVRQHATEWGIASDRIGIMGFSAGGRVAAGLALEYDAETRPNFAAPIYAAIWEEINVPADAPPLFVAVAADDALVGMEPSLHLFSAWRKAGKQAELHVYGEGDHGFGMRVQGLPSDHWIEPFYQWMKRQTGE